MDKDGYDKKTCDQLLTFFSYGWDSFVICFNGNSVITAKAESKQLKIFKSSFSVTNILLRRALLIIQSISFIYKHRPTFLYIRYPRADPICTILLMAAKIISKKIKIVYEIPTYPFEKEIDNNFRLRALTLKFGEKIFRPLVSELISAYAVIAFKENAFGKKSIHIENGVPESRGIILPGNYLTTCNLVFVANFNDSNRRHGLDRLIAGLRNFLDSRNSLEEKLVVLHVVGNIEPSSKIFSLLEKSELSRFVKFYGKLSYDQLTELYSAMHVGIGCLAFHRIGVSHTSALKEREYLSFGLPVVSSSDDYLLGEQFPYRLRVPADDSPVFIDGILQFARRCYSGSGKSEIYKYTIAQANWSVAMSGVKQYIEN